MSVIRPLAVGLGLLVSFAMAEELDDVAKLLKADAKQFAELAARDEPDPWLVASRLLAAGHGELALKFAELKPRPAVAGLAAYLRSKPPFDPAVQLVRERVLVRLEDAETTREMLAADLRAIEAVFAQANRLEQAQLQAMRGFARVYTGEVQAGHRDFLAAHAAARELGWLRGAADALGTASENARVLYDQDEAVRLARKELTMRWELQDEQTTLLHLRRLVEVINEVGDAEAALAELGAWSEKLGEAVELDRASLLLRLADPEGTLGLVLVQDTGRAHMLAGDALRQLGRESEALAHYRKAIEKFDKDQIRRGHALGNAGISLLRLNRAQDARQLLEKAQNEFDAAKDRGLVALAVLHRGDAHLAAADAPGALRLFNSARTYASRTGDGWLEAEALVRRGRALLALQDLVAARKAFSACREIANELAFHELSAAGSLGEARCFLRQGRPKLAAAAGRHGREALDPLIAGRPVPAGDEARRLHTQLCACEVEAALAIDSDADLWLAIERQRLGLPRYSRGQLKKIRASAMTPQQIELEQRLRGSIARLQMWEDRARQEEDRKTAVRFKADRENSERKLRQLVETVRLRGRPGWELLFGVPTPLSMLRPRLDRDQALVSVASAGNRAAAILVSLTEVRRIPIERGGAVKLKVNSLVLIGPTLDLRWDVGGIVRAPSATEFALLKSRTSRTDPVVLASPPSMRELRKLFLAGSLSVLAPSKQVPAAQATDLRKRVANHEAIALHRTTDWRWWGTRQ